MSLKPYAEMKDSEIEWLGDVPRHWSTKRLGWLCRKIGSGKTPTGGAEVYRDDGILLIRSQNVCDEGLILSDAAYIDDGIDETMANSRVEANDILLNITGASLGRSCLVPSGIGRANVNQHVCIIRLSDTSLTKFVAWALGSTGILAQIDAVQNGAAREGLNFVQIGRLLLTIPERSEIPEVVRFLDRETAKIDALVAEQEKLIALLAEKRRAVISHAVTKGLDPNAPMKDSGIEWLGDVPAHWVVAPIKHCASIRGRIGFRGYAAEDLVDEGNGALALGGANLTIHGRLDFAKLTYLSWEKFEESPEIKVQIDDVLVGQRGTCGSAVLVDQNIGPATINPSLVILRPLEILGAYICYSIMGEHIQAVFGSFLNATAVPMLSQAQIGSVLLCRPPMEEQMNIVAHLDRITAKLDTLTLEAERGIALLKERRAALISAAVTGKIDVRGHVAAEGAAA